MKRYTFAMAAALGATLTFQPILAMAGSSGRIIPNGKVGILAGDKEVRELRSEAPLPEGSYMVCEGNCMVQAPGLQLIARDRAVFAVVHAEDGWNVAVKSGRIVFGVKRDVKSLAFQTPQDVLNIRQIVVPASTEGIVRGSLSVTDKGSELTVDQGMLNVAYNGGEQLVSPDKPMLLAQAGGVLPGGAMGGGQATYVGMSQDTAIIAGAGVIAIGAAAGAVVAETGGGSSSAPAPNSAE